LKSDILILWTIRSQQKEKKRIRNESSDDPEIEGVVTFEDCLRHGPWTNQEILLFGQVTKNRWGKWAEIANEGLIPHRDRKSIQGFSRTSQGKQFKPHKNEDYNLDTLCDLAKGFKNLLEVMKNQQKKQKIEEL